MKQILTTLLTLAISLNLINGFSQSIDTITISKNMFSIGRPDIDTVLNSEYKYIKLDIDTLFVTNKYFLDEYQQCIADYNTLRETCENLVVVQEMFNRIKPEFDTLRFNLTKIEDAYQKSLDGNLKTIDILRTDNARQKQSLENAKANLAKAEDLIKQERWNNLGTKMLWGVGGTAVGVLFSGFIVSIAK